MNVSLNCKRSRATTSLLSSVSIHKQERERRAAFIDGIATIPGRPNVWLTVYLFRWPVTWPVIKRKIN